MSSSAINNLSESLDLVKGTLEAILTKEAEFQKLIAKEVAMLEQPEEFIRSYNRNRTMVKLSFIASGEENGISNTSDFFRRQTWIFPPGRVWKAFPFPGHT